MICVICLFIGQSLITKNENQNQSEMDGKICQNMKFTTPSSHTYSFLSKTKHLENIRLHIAFTVFVNSLKKFFEQTKIELFKKMSNYFYIHCFYKYLNSQGQV